MHIARAPGAIRREIKDQNNQDQRAQYVTAMICSVLEDA